MSLNFASREEFQWNFVSAAVQFFPDLMMMVETGWAEARVEDDDHQLILGDLFLLTAERLIEELPGLGLEFTTASSEVLDSHLRYETLLDFYREFQLDSLQVTFGRLDTRQREEVDAALAPFWDGEADEVECLQTFLAQLIKHQPLAQSWRRMAQIQDLVVSNGEFVTLTREAFAETLPAPPDVFTLTDRQSVAMRSLIAITVAKVAQWQPHFLTPDQRIDPDQLALDWWAGVTTNGRFDASLVNAYNHRGKHSLLSYAGRAATDSELTVVMLVRAAMAFQQLAGVTHPDGTLNAEAIEMRLKPGRIPPSPSIVRYLELLEQHLPQLLELMGQTE